MSFKVWKIGVIRCLFAFRSNAPETLCGMNRLSEKSDFAGQMTIFVAQISSKGGLKPRKV